MKIDEFINEIQKMNISPTLYQLKQLEKYYNLLIEYNKHINLTNITEKEDVYLKHFYDSLTIAKIINLNEIETACDFGTGAGFPGIIIKIFFPHIKMTLIDSLNKRIKFLNVVIKELSLNNIETKHIRIEEYGKNNREQFDLVMARAVANTNILLEYSMPIVKINGYFIAMKGKLEDINNLKDACKKLYCTLVNLKQFYLPIEDSERCLLLFQKNKKTQMKYPRSYKEIKINNL